MTKAKIAIIVAGGKGERMHADILMHDFLAEINVKCPAQPRAQGAGRDYRTRRF